MHRYFKAVLLLTFLSSGFFSFKIDEGIVAKIVKQLEVLHIKNPQEKIYLHTDKPYYMVGETIWYKGYLFDGTNHETDTVSKILYLELINEESQKTVIKQILRCNGVTNGDIALSDTLSEGIYRLVAYTNYMKNFSNEFYFHKTIQIFKNEKKYESTNNTIERDYKIDLQFFPEGGNAVCGLEGRVGFKATDSYGKGIDITGAIVDEKKDTLLYFNSVHLGMGYFNFLPEKHKNYQAVVKLNNGDKASFQLPIPQTNGYSLAVNNLIDQGVKIFVRKEEEQSGNKEDLTLVAHQRGKLCYIAKINANQKNVATTIPKKEIPDDGIVQITLINSLGEPIAERLIFIEKGNQAIVKATINKQIYISKEKVIIDVEAKDKNGKPLEGNFSIAVTDANQVNSLKNSQNIYTYLLLESDASQISKNEYFPTLKGTIEQPAYYFDKANEEAAIHLDILLMTQGYRKFAWHDIIEDKFVPITYAIEQSLSLTGSVAKKNGKSITNNMVMLMMKNENSAPFITMTEITETGRYGFYNLDFENSKQVLVQVLNKALFNNYQVNIDLPQNNSITRLIKVPFMPIDFDTKALDLFLKQAIESQLFEKKLKLNKEQLLNEVIVKGKKNEENDTRRFYGMASNTILVDDAICGRARNVFEILKTKMIKNIRIPNTVGVGAGGGPTFGPPGGGGPNGGADPLGLGQNNGEPLYLLDGITVLPDMLNSIEPCNIDKIDILKPGAESAMFGSKGFFGVVSVLTRKGTKADKASSILASNAALQTIQGYHISRLFYSPKYEVATEFSPYPDYRATIFWEPKIKTNKLGKASLSFYNSEAKTKVNVIIEGVSLSGRVGHGKLQYEVR